MDKLLEEVAAEKQLINATLEELQKILQRDRIEFVEMAAMATCLLNFYNGVENLFKRALGFLQVPLPTSPTSHRDLLELVVEHRIISQQLSETLDEYRAFRHYFVHGYGILLQEAPLKSLCENLASIWQNFEDEFGRFLSSQGNLKN